MSFEFCVRNHSIGIGAQESFVHSGWGTRLKTQAINIDVYLSIINSKCPMCDERPCKRSKGDRAFLLGDGAKLKIVAKLMSHCLHIYLIAERTYIFALNSCRTHGNIAARRQWQRRLISSNFFFLQSKQRHMPVANFGTLSLGDSNKSFRSKSIKINSLFFACHLHNFTSHRMCPLSTLPHSAQLWRLIAWFECGPI